MRKGAADMAKERKVSRAAYAHAQRMLLKGTAQWQFKPAPKGFKPWPSRPFPKRVK
jgi:hypothetical protein